MRNSSSGSEPVRRSRRDRADVPGDPDARAAGLPARRLRPPCRVLRRLDGSRAWPAGIAAATLVSFALYAYERRAGRDGLLVRLSLAFVLVQAVVGLVSGSTVVYLATPVLANAIWAAAFLVSAAVRRPLAGALACAWYPFSRRVPRHGGVQARLRLRVGGLGPLPARAGAACGLAPSSTAASAASSSSRSRPGRR